MALTQEELLRQQQEKLAGIAQQQQMAQQRTPGQVVGETPEQFAAGKAAANSQAAGYNLFQQRQTVAAKPQPTQQPQPVVQQTAPVKTTPVVDPNSATSGMDAILANMYTSPEQEEKMRKASVANQRILAIGDALRHIGNIYNTVNYAPSQQFNKPWEEEYNRYEKGKAVRDAANQRYLSYQQQKAAQDAKAKQWEATYNLQLANAAAQQQYRKDKLKADDDRWKATFAYKAANDDANRKQRQGQYDKQNALRERSLGIQAQNAKNMQAYRQWRMNGGGSGKGSTPYRYAAPYGGTIELPKGLNTTQIDQIVTNKDFQKYRNRSALQEAMIKAGVNTNDPAQARRYEAAKMMQEHPEVAEYVAKRFGGTVTGMQTPPLDSQASGMNGWIAPGNSWSQPGSNYNWDNYLDGGIGATPVNNDDDDEAENWDDFLVD